MDSHTWKVLHANKKIQIKICTNGLDPIKVPRHLGAPNNLPIYMGCYRQARMQEAVNYTSI